MGLIMIDKNDIEDITRRLVNAYSPKAIYLFGSYAWGLPNEQSDLDLLVIVESSDEPSYIRPRIGERALIGVLVSRDIIVYTADEFKMRASDVSTLCYKVKREGKLLYGNA